MQKQVETCEFEYGKIENIWNMNGENIYMETSGQTCRENSYGET